MKKKVATAAIAAMTMTFLAGCSSRGTYAKYLTLGEYKGLNVTKVKTEVTDDDVEAEIESALDENAEYTDVDRAAKDGDQVNIDFDGSIDGEAWDSDTDYDLVIGSEDFQPEFEEHLIGAKAGDTLEFTITLSDDYDGDYAGKDADFKVTVNAVQEINVPELNDDYCKKYTDYDTVDAIRKKMIVFGIGPAGTGKTYLAMAMAIQAFKNDEVGRIILTRPAIEAGEKLGFLPGDLQSKIDPYLRPLYDALYQIMGPESFAKNMEKGLIEVAPLAYMRGRTLDNAFIILDEAQNTTPAQMKMFLTRIGFGSKVIITGDKTQKDLPSSAASGLDVAMKVLKKVDGISFCELTSKDVVRHPLVQKIVQAYEEYEKKAVQKKTDRTVKSKTKTSTGTTRRKS